MKLSTSRIMLPVLLVVLAASSGCGIVNGIRAKSELNDGALAYRTGDYAQAQQHFEKAIALDPAQKNAPLFRARSIEQQSRGGNEAKAREAIVAYQEIMRNDPYNEEAYNGIARMYRVLKDDAALLPRRSEGLGEARWILLDYLDVVLHVFTPDAREFYRLENLWGDAPKRVVE